MYCICVFAQCGCLYILFLLIVSISSLMLLLLLCRLVTLVLTVFVLNTVHHSPLLAVCALLTGAAAYLQSTYVSFGVQPHCYCTILLYCMYDSVTKVIMYAVVFSLAATVLYCMYDSVTKVIMYAVVFRWTRRSWRWTTKTTTRAQTRKTKLLLLLVGIKY